MVCVGIIESLLLRELEGEDRFRLLGDRPHPIERGTGLGGEPAVERVARHPGREALRGELVVGTDPDGVDTLDERPDRVDPRADELTGDRVGLDGVGRVRPLALVRIGEVEDADPHLSHVARALDPSRCRPR